MMSIWMYSHQFLYKLISKILAECLKPWLHNIISKNQFVFIPGRLITYNVLIIAHEMMHSLVSTYEKH